jgi:hypothetical protein
MKTNKKIRSAINCPFGHHLALWQRAHQEGQADLVRFRQYVRQHQPKIRIQNGHGHTNSIMTLATVYMYDLSQYIPLNQGLLIMCFWLHDQPEGFLGRDILLTDKSASHDADEYRALRRHFENHSGVWENSIQIAYLLQFCIKSDTELQAFGDEACKTMQWLRKDFEKEAWFFRGIELIDYLYWAYEAYEVHGHRHIIEEVTRNNFANLDEVARNLPGFKEVVWTSEVRSFFRQFIPKKRRKK